MWRGEGGRWEWELGGRWDEGAEGVEWGGKLVEGGAVRGKGKGWRFAVEVEVGAVVGACEGREGGVVVVRGEGCAAVEDAEDDIFVSEVFCVSFPHLRGFLRGFFVIFVILVIVLSIGSCYRRANMMGNKPKLTGWWGDRDVSVRDVCLGSNQQVRSSGSGFRELEWGR